MDMLKQMKGKNNEKCVFRYVKFTNKLSLKIDFQKVDQLTRASGYSTAPTTNWKAWNSPVEHYEC